MSKGAAYRFARSAARRGVGAFLLLLMTVLLNVVVPGHTRGIVTLTGHSSVAGLADLGCPFCQPVSHDKGSRPSDSDRSQCAICSLAVRLTVEPPVNFHLDFFGLLTILPPAPPMLVIAAAPRSLPTCRGPPAVSVA